jgi:tetratricopeptide (TPR) repeat protein
MNLLSCLIFKKIQVEPYDAEAYMLRGKAKVEIEDFKEAILDFDKALELDPKLEEAKRLRYQTNREFEYREARERLKNHFYNPPFNKEAELYFNRGMIKKRIKFYQEALHDFNRVIASNPEYDLGYYNRGLVKHKLKDYLGAIEDYTKAIEISPDSSTFYNERGNSKYCLMDFNSAIDDYYKTKEICPDYYEAYNNLGLAKYNLSLYEEAIKDFNAAIQLIPEYEEPHIFRGLSKYQLGDEKGAILDWIRASELGDSSGDDLIEMFFRK